MSGICAYVRVGGNLAEPARVDAGLVALTGVGPAASGVWHGFENGFSLGMGVVASDVPSADSLWCQPAVAEGGTIRIVADAHIDGRLALVTQLRLSAREGAALGDADLLLAAYRKWGESFARHIRGDFAFIIWDSRRLRLVCGRDHLGHRPLAYRQTLGILAVASTPEAVVRMDRGPRRLDLEKVAGFLALGFDPERTFYEGVRRVPAGHTLVFDGRTGRLERYWSMDDVARIRFDSDAAYVEAFRKTWGETLSHHVQGTGDVGVLMSGGLDSTSVAAMAAEQIRERGGKLIAFHAAPREGFLGPARDGWINDETEDVRAVADLHANIELEIVRPSGRTFLDGLEPFFHHAGMPVPNADNRVWVETIFCRARERGVTSLLGGFKGNSTISYSGLRGLRELAFTGRWASLVREARALAGVRQRPLFQFIEYAVTPAVVDTLRAHYQAVRGHRLPPIEQALSTPIRAEFAREHHVEEQLREIGMDPRYPDRSTGRQYRKRILARTGEDADLYRALRAIYGVEARDPTSDVRVVEFCLGIPESQYLHAGHERRLVRRAMKGLVPEHVLERTTRGTQAADWAEGLTAMRDQLRDELDEMNRCETVRHCIDVAKLRALLDRWPDTFTIEHGADYRHRLTRGIMAGAFIRWFERQRPVEAA